MDETLRGDALNDHLKAKGCAPLLLCKRNKQRRMQHDKLEQITLARRPSLQNRMIQKNESKLNLSPPSLL
ncbi:hypothetical protein ACFX13_036374 [Malus domestica]